MQALQANQYGPPSVLQYVETRSPVITSSTQMIIKVFASGVNPADWKARCGNFSNFVSIPMPAIFGADFSGEVVAIGEDIQNFKVGQEVFGTLTNPLCGAGSMAEYLRVDTKKDVVLIKPSTITHAEAAGAGIPMLTAWDGLVFSGKLPIDEEAEKLQPKPKVVIIGASGGCGTFAVQIAKNVNHAYVVGICSAKNSEFVKKLGADRVIDYKSQDFAEVLRDERESFDLVVDFVGGNYFEKSIPLLKKKGVFVTACGSEEFAAEKVGLAKVTGVGVGLLWKKAFGARKYSHIIKLPYKEYPKLIPYMEKRQVVTVINQEFELKDGAKAHEASEQGRTVGKLIVKV